ncbi:DNA polymerase delta, subunit 4-domain-containing protein [Mycena galericulata]|nr:DNA polymerase delta, subunit 4-domain-containing protein [Mycena galericulata]
MPKSTFKPSPSLKQATLSFSASKRTASDNSRKVAPRRPTLSVDSDNEIDVDDIEMSSSDDDDDEVEIIESDGPTGKVTKAAPVKQRSIIKVTRPREKATQNELLELNEKDRKWDRHHKAARTKRGSLPLIHAEDQDKFHDILRVFDLSYEYGPCIGVPRLERWERASAMGLNPPSEVRDILTTRQGASDPSYSQSVFYDQV